MKRLALVGFPDGLARQDITPTQCSRDRTFDESYTDPATPIKSPHLLIEERAI
jgi:hypothetical protein